MLIWRMLEDKPTAFIIGWVTAWLFVYWLLAFLLTVLSVVAWSFLRRIANQASHCN